MSHKIVFIIFSKYLKIILDLWEITTFVNLFTLGVQLWPDRDPPVLRRAANDLRRGDGRPNGMLRLQQVFKNNYPSKRVVFKKKLNLLS